MCSSYRVVFPPRTHLPSPVFHPHFLLHSRAHGTARHFASGSGTVDTEDTEVVVVVAGGPVVGSSAAVMVVVVVAVAVVVVVAAAVGAGVCTIVVTATGSVVAADVAAAVAGAAVVGLMSTTSPLPDDASSSNMPNVSTNASVDHPPGFACGLAYAELQQPPVFPGMLDPQNVRKFRASPGLRVASHLKAEPPSRPAVSV